MALFYLQDIAEWIELLARFISLRSRHNYHDTFLLKNELRAT